MFDITIKQFTAIARQECNEHNQSAHEDDQFPFNEWLSENGKEYASKYGIAVDRSTGDLVYLRTNKNHKGDMKCESCGDFYEDNDETGDLCPECYHNDE